MQSVESIRVEYRIQIGLLLTRAGTRQTNMPCIHNCRIYIERERRAGHNEDSVYEKNKKKQQNSV